jgi:putative endonuclease
MREHKYFVYIVCSNSGTLYIGMTNCIYRRALQHKRGEIEGFSARYACDRLVYYESFDDVRWAIDREKQLKRWVRRKKIALIESRNPRWADLAEKWGSKIAFPNQSIRECAPIRRELCHPERSSTIGLAERAAQSKDLPA